MSTSTPTGMPGVLRNWLAFTKFLSEDFLGGPRPFKLATVINLQKGGTLPFVLALMWCFDNWSVTAFTYAALHGSYGVVWLLKECAFPDPSWQKPVTIGAAFNAFALVLGPYWLAPWLLVSSRLEQPAWLLGTAIFTFTIGIVLMIGSDAQKFFTLQHRRGLITIGFYKHVRHPNYLGEMLLYASFALVAGHIVPWLILAWVWLGAFVPNMLAKESSMSRYPEWSAYHNRTGFLLPRFQAPKTD
jgi:protein-S-isoprenylcysteine O-methyltransferase Ste14